MKRRDFIALLASTAALALPGCQTQSLPTYRYRLTVEVETPQGLRTGSSVIEVQNGLGWVPGNTGASFATRARGEAVAVDLPGGRTLFALLRGDDGYADWAGRIVFDLTPEPPRAKDEDNRGDQVRNAAADRSLKIVPNREPIGQGTRSRYPLLVTFTDIRDPKTVTRVDPENLGASFGPGVTLRRITVQVTDDPVTTGIEKRLGWLPQFYDKMLDGSTNNNSTQLANSLSMGDFQQGTAR